MARLFLCVILFGFCAAQQCAPEVQPLQSLAAFSTVPPSYAQQQHDLLPGPVWGSLRAPLPTNSFFTNVGVNASYFPIAPYPYHVKVEDTGVVISYAEWKSVTSTYITTPFIGNLILTAEQEATMRIESYDQLSVTLKWTQNEGSGTLTSPIVRGSPFITMVYSQMTPIIKSSHALLTVNGNGGSGPFNGTEFSVRMNNGQQWKIFSLNGVPITFYKRSNQLVCTSAFTGVLRAAVIAGQSDEASIANAAQTYPTGASISYSFLDDLATIQFKWRTAGGCPENLLMMALPHHMDSIVLSDTLRAANVTYQTIKGRMTGLRGNTWILKEQLTHIKWSSPRAIPADKVASVRAALMQEKGRRNYVGDPYTAGKVLASMARLALIADELNENETARAIRANLKADIDPWLLGTNWNALKYETAWGGLCSSHGLADMNADYGQGWYNDHHFHYGYIVYAAAVVGKEDKEWLNSRRSAIMDIVRDYANPSSTDPHFPMTRNKDWFDGHSWASGLFPFGDSKNQESTSESVNAYYGVYLLGESLGDTQLSNWGRMLLATEIRSVHKYWQITEASQIYPAPFKDGKIVGVLWSTKVDYATFFGGNAEFIHCIQMMPFTPITEELLPAAWVREEYPVLRQVLTRTTDPIGEGWKGFVYMDHAIIDREAAWAEVQTLRWYDNGNSKTNTLHWVATRPPTSQKRISLN
jgi:endo-1,3(4)-beta-glucanase